MLSVAHRSYKVPCYTTQHGSCVFSMYLRTSCIYDNTNQSLGSVRHWKKYKSTIKQWEFNTSASAVQYLWESRYDPSYIQTALRKAAKYYSIQAFRGLKVQLHKFLTLTLGQFYCQNDRLCGLVVRVLGYRSGGPGSIPGTNRKKKKKN
jgi:hypothetical protein